MSIAYLYRKYSKPYLEKFGMVSFIKKKVKTVLYSYPESFLNFIVRVILAYSLSDLYPKEIISSENI